MKTSTKILVTIMLGLFVATFITLYKPLGFAATGVAVFIVIFCEDVRKQF